MVYDSKTYELLHRPTPEGRALYRVMLEEKATELIFKHEHPFRWFFQKLKELFD